MLKNLSGVLAILVMLLATSACDDRLPGLQQTDTGGGSFSGIAPDRAPVPEQMAATPVPAADNGVNAGNSIADVIEPKVIRQGEVMFETSNVVETRDFLLDLVRRFEGYTSSDNQYRLHDRLEAQLIVRVPSSNFDPLLTELEGRVGRFESKSISASDVTEEYLDLSVRIQIKKETEQRYREILSQAKSVKDILEVERYISQLRSDIESLEGRLNYLANRVSYSTLTIRCYQLNPRMIGFSSRLSVALNDGWNNFIWFVLGVIALWPFLLAGILLIVVLLLIGRLKR
ncbi:MAG: DUF4349 domain-containing protein [Prosthecochloris sp.]|uniref:DUF4349 domain-containing protein n=1 Tax=Prosthecochloris aestuarii (strain DSM 271 / SK 413) TaxID=290512 RepID=B4S4P6_PROA2|nr:MULTISPECIES: DUF4349 domain-containing protein [Prosthecochloris]ACF46942.1 hypothetical protein Paes_1930 [Prosthecochloris aestuarii DSM 271]MCW8798796.1 DUF4349 domain-containing protein [Prosthecochloris sp.]RDD29528.1 DUF4349 domain-containing protein [Prosthecochloris sp. ZM]